MPTPSMGIQLKSAGFEIVRDGVVLVRITQAEPDPYDPANPPSTPMPAGPAVNVAVLTKVSVTDWPQLSTLIGQAMSIISTMPPV